MKETIRIILEAVPGGRRLLKAYGLHRLHRRIREGKHAEELFTHYYEANLWGSDESASGPGSTVEYTEGLRVELGALLGKLNVHTMLDAPCGDYNWFRFVPRRDDVQYIGGDIVGSLVASNQERFGNENTRFMQFDITRDSLPDADLWMCRDVLFHLSNRDALSAIANFLSSNIRYLLASSHT